MSSFRAIYITDVSANWRGMTIFPIALGIPIGILIIFTIKETSKYEEIKDSKVTGALFMAENLKAIFKSSARKQYIIVLIMSFLNALGYAFIVLGENYVSTIGHLTEKQVNNLIIIIALSVIVGYLFTGILADKIGRKPMLYIHSVIMPIAITIVVIGTTMTPSSFTVISIGIALSYVSYWGLLIVLRLIAAEIVATDRRGTGSGFRALISSIGITSVLFLSGGMILLLGQSLTFLFLSIPVVINLVLGIKYIKETKGINLSEVK